MEKKLYGTVLIKAAQILDSLSEGKSKTIQQIANDTGNTPPTVLKILETLIYIGYVAKNSRTKEYSLGPKFIQYGSKESTETNFVKLTQPYLEELQETIDETIHLAVPQNDEVMYVNKLEPKNQNIYMTSKIGMTRSLYSAGMGKAVLSTYNDEELAKYLAKTPLVAKTEFTITDPEELKKDLAKIREEGYAIDNEEQELDCYCVATTLGKEDHVIGAMSVSLPKFRVTPQYRAKIISELLETKQKIEEAL